MPKQKSIVFIVPDMNQGGAERIITLLLQHFQHSEFKLYLVLMRKEGYYLEMIPDNVEIINLKKERIRQSIFALLKTIKKLKPSYVFSGYGEVNAFISPFIPLFRNTKFIARETNVVSEHVTRKSIQFFYKFYNNFHSIIAQSTDMKEDLIDNWNIKKEKIQLIHNPIDVPFVSAKSQEFFPEEFHAETKKVVAVGNVSYRKGFDHLLQVFTYLKEENIELFIIGKGAQMDEFQQFKKENDLEKVHFLGRKNNPFPYVKNADLFVLSSRYEGFPNVLLEAGICGTYALANDCKGGINEIIQPKINGEILSVEKHEEYAGKIKELVFQDTDKEKVKQSIAGRYHQEIIFKQYETIFNH